MKHRFLSWSLLFVLSATAPCVLAQDQAPAPSFNDGDTWQFNISPKGFLTYSTERLSGAYELVFSQGQLKAYSVSGNQRTEMDIKSEGPGSGLPSLIGIQEERPTLKFPLSVGQKWKYEFENKPLGAREAFKFFVEVAVTGMEQVATPAGSFKAYKLVRNQQRRAAGRQVKWIGTTVTYFYSPETKSIVRSKTENDDGPGTTETELIKFTPGK